MTFGVGAPAALQFIVASLPSSTVILLGPSSITGTDATKYSIGVKKTKPKKVFTVYAQQWNMQTCQKNVSRYYASTHVEYVQIKSAKMCLDQIKKIYKHFCNKVCLELHQCKLHSEKTVSLRGGNKTKLFLLCRSPIFLNRIILGSTLLVFLSYSAC